MFDGPGGNKQVIKGGCLMKNKFNFQNYQNVLDTNQPHETMNRCFMCRNHNTYTYKQQKEVSVVSIVKERCYMIEFTLRC